MWCRSTDSQHREDWVCCSDDGVDRFTWFFLGLELGHGSATLMEFRLHEGSCLFLQLALCIIHDGSWLALEHGTV